MGGGPEIGEDKGGLINNMLISLGSAVGTVRLVYPNPAGQPFHTVWIGYCLYHLLFNVLILLYLYDADLYPYMHTVYI
jgi:hypothetical protein